MDAVLTMLMPGADRQALSFVAACYRVADDIETWMARALEAATPLLERGAGLHAYAYAIGPSGTVVPRSAVVETASSPSGVAALALPAAMAVPPTLAVSLFCRSGPIVSSLDRTRELGASFTDFKPFELLRSLGLADIIGVSAYDPSGFGVLFGAPTERPRPVLASERRRWSLLRTHLLAGLRLHSMQRAEEGDAILSSSGRILHACGTARAQTARSALQRRALQIERARNGRNDTEAALLAWRGLVDGTWSLVDRFDHDGRRYVVAYRNDPRVTSPMVLSERERQVAGYAALGYSNKRIAYALGLAPSTVSSHLRSAMRRLGCESVTALARLWIDTGYHRERST